MKQFCKWNWCRSALILALFFWSSAGLVTAQDSRPYSKEGPIWVDFDMKSIPEPQDYETGYAYDLINGSVFQKVKQSLDLPRQFRRLAGDPKEAYNVNTYDEVPDSSWFTNRNGRRRMSLEEIKRGPNKNDGPVGGPFTVLRGKTRGVMPGFWIRDKQGETYILKFDPPDYPELSSAAEVISTKLFYAIGYNVPQNYIFRFRREQLRLDPKATFTDASGKKRTMTEEDLDGILKRVARQPDGQYRSMASKLIKGKNIGNITFIGVKPDDPNDIIPHEHRRDLRGLRVFSAWLEHDDMRTENTLNFYVNEGGRSFIRHYIFDFGATLGSFSYEPNPPIIGHEYNLDVAESTKTMLSLGLRPQPWLDSKADERFPGVGNYSSTYFDPPRWKQMIPLVAFENMTDSDAYWAAKIVGSFTDEQIRAAVETGEYSDPDSAQYMTEQIIKRRDKILRSYLYRKAALDRFRIEKSSEGFTLRFDDLREALKENRKNLDTYDYEIGSVNESKKLIDRGSISKLEFVFPPQLLQKIGACGKTEADRGVARLTLRRHGEAHYVQVYLYYDTANDTLRVVGVKN